ncbi:SDR family oxidoreductase [Apilactobacillus kunkeei]|uniref:SDR family oxidoreductase n=1 Tax=Apilactobacillus kunkeei TaxID=148814 RepID=UPI00403386A3
MSNVLVIGAHGHVGFKMVEKLGKTGDNVFAGVRSDNQFSEYNDMRNVTPVVFNLNGTIDEMAKVYTDNSIDKIVFSAGSGGATGDDQTLIIDLDGAVKSMLAAKQAGVTRYVMVSAMGADDRSFWANSGLHGYYIAKHYADVALINSGLQYTIVRPSALTNDEETGKVDVIEQRASGMNIPRKDVANFVVAVLHDDKTINHIYEITSGSSDINDVL